MPTQLSPLLIAALLLNNFIVAQHIGLRPVKSLAQTGGVVAVGGIALTMGAAIDWMIFRWLLQPLASEYLRYLVAVPATAAIAQIAELILRRKHPHWFPAYGTLLPLIITNSAILLLALLQRSVDDSFITRLIAALGYGCAAAIVLLAFQSLRERSAGAQQLPAAFRGAALDLFNAGLLIAALSGIATLFQAGG